MKNLNMNIVIVGHVDHGKSTIIGRLLTDTYSLPQGKLEMIQEFCRKNSKPFEYAFLLDALKDEQEQGITIDTARCFFKTEKRNYTLIDAPGHIEFLKNMITGASRAEAALLVIDAHEGIQENSRRHGFMLSMLGVKQICILVNKMDLINYDQNTYVNIVNEYKSFLKKINVKPQAFIPVSGINGDNIAFSSSKMNWFQGKTVLEMLDAFHTESIPLNKPFRMPVQAVYKFTEGGDKRRIVAGTIESGIIHTGDKVVFYPSGKISSVKTIEAFNKQKQLSASAGSATGFTLTEQIYVKRGELAVIYDQSKPKVATRLKVNIFWLGCKPMERNHTYTFKIGTTKVSCKLEEIIRGMNASNLKTEKAEVIQRHEVAECILKLDKAVAFDVQEDIIQTSRFVIVDEYEISGGGIIQSALDNSQIAEKRNIRSISRDTHIVWHEGKVTYEDRCKSLRQQGLVVWFTGLSSSGKSTIAVEVEKELIQRGISAYRLDGDNIRHGLNSDLGFSETDRNENIRRIAEVAALFKDAGLITLVSFISPYRKMRKFAREKTGLGSFMEVYVKADVETCARRDPKGLYMLAKKGEIKNFTGVDSPYEEPEYPDLVLDTDKLEIRECVDKLLMKILQHLTKSSTKEDSEKAI